MSNSNSSSSSSSSSRMAFFAVLLLLHCASAAAADPGCNKPCPVLSLRPCTTLAPGGVSTGCKNGQCISGPVINSPDGSSCGESNVCWKGSCVPNKCQSAKVRCPAGATPKQPTCNPLTGQCLTTTTATTKPKTTTTTAKPQTVTPAAVPKPAQDGTPCGSGSVIWKGACVADKCQGKLCPVMSLALCTTIAPGGTSGECNPTTGNCDLGPVVPVADGTDCGLGKCKAGKCVPEPGMPTMQPMLP